MTPLNADPGLQRPDVRYADELVSNGKTRGSSRYSRNLLRDVVEFHDVEQTRRSKRISSLNGFQVATPGHPLAAHISEEC